MDNEETDVLDGDAMTEKSNARRPSRFARTIVYLGTVRRIMTASPVFICLRRLASCTIPSLA